MTLQIKNALAIIFAALVALFSGWLVTAYFEKTNTWIPILGTVLSLAGQIYISIWVRSKEEVELDLYREARLAKTKQKISEAEALSAKIQAEIRAGNLQSAVECMKIRDLL